MACGNPVRPAAPPSASWVTTADAALPPDDGGRDAAAGTGRLAMPVPDELPAPRAVVGRDAELRLLDQALAGDRNGRRIAVVSGPPGMGRTALAAWWLHQHRDRFPAGLFYTRLSGGRAVGESPQAALGRWLRALGVPPPWIPAAPAERNLLWQTVTGGQPLALLIDDAPSAAVIRPLLPGPGPARVLVTSRQMLAAATDPAGQVRLRPLTHRSAVALLAQELARAQVLVAADVRTKLARACGGLPLALVCAARLAAGCRGSLAGLVTWLEEEQRRLRSQGVSRVQAGAWAVIEAAHRSLDPRTARVWRLLACCPGPEISAGLAAAMLGTDTGEAARLLDELASAGLIDACGDTGSAWWRLHDTIRSYARAQVRPDEAGTGRQAILHRYADELVSAYEVLAASGCGRAGTGPACFPGPAAAAAWAGRNEPTTMAALEVAAARADHADAVMLATALWPLLELRGCYDGQLAAARIGARAGHAAGDSLAEAQLLTGMASALVRLGRAREAAACLRRTSRLWRRLGDDGQLAAALLDLGQAQAAAGSHAAAVQSLRHALDLYQRGGHEHGALLALIGLGETLTGSGRPTEALTRLRQAGKLLAAQPDLYLEARARTALGTALRNPDTAAANLARALTIMRKLHRLPEQAALLHTLGDLATRTGQPDLARRHYQQALDLLPVTHPATRQIRVRLCTLPDTAGIHCPPENEDQYDH